MKKVIFVGGTAFSGSTLLAMILSNDSHGFACGEPQNYLNPTKYYHNKLVCGCGDKNCDIWPQVKKADPERIYEAIFGLFPETEFIVDSSKNLFWIRSQIQYLAKRGIETKNVLIWKSPIEIAHSFKKRGRLSAWERSWVNYHRLYYTLIDDWMAIKYKDLTENSGALNDICKYLGISNFPGKRRYWDKVQHVIGWNISAKIHLYDKGSSSYKLSEADDPISIPENNNHRSIYYHNVSDPSLTYLIEEQVDRSKYIHQLLALLEAYDRSNEKLGDQTSPSLRFPAYSIALRSLKRRMKFAYGRRLFRK